MPFLLAEILNFQDSAHLKGVGSLSTLINIKINPVHPVRLQSYDSLR